MATANIGDHLSCFLNSDRCSCTDCTGLDPPLLRGICSPATVAKTYAKIFICLYAKVAKMSDFSNHNIFAYMLASCANLNFHPVAN